MYNLLKFDELIYTLDYKLTSIGNQGYLLHSGKPSKSTKLVLFDLDDTLVDLSLKKQERLEQLHTFLERYLGIEISREISDDISTKINAKSKFKDDPQTEEVLHISEDLTVLSWYYAQLKKAIDKGETIEEVREKLDTILAGKDDIHPFSYEDEKLVINKEIQDIPELEDIYMNSIFQPVPFPIFSDVLDGKAGSFDWGIFTFGDPYFQLYKIYNTLRMYANDFPRIIFLTRSMKKPFLEKIIREEYLDDHYEKIIILDDKLQHAQELSELTISHPSISSFLVTWQANGKILRLTNPKTDEIRSLHTYTELTSFLEKI